MPTIEASKNTQPIDRPINGELLALLAETGSSKKKRTNNRGKGGLTEWNASETQRETKRGGWRKESRNKRQR